jgi:hypothetical protein
VEAQEVIDRLVAERAYSRVEGWLRETGMSEHAAHELVANAVDRIDAGFAVGGPYNHVEGRTVGGGAPSRSRFAAGVRAPAGHITGARTVVRLARSSVRCRQLHQ